MAFVWLNFILLCLIIAGLSVLYLRLAALHSYLAHLHDLMLDEFHSLRKENIGGFKDIVKPEQNDRENSFEDELHDLKLNVNTQLQNQNVSIAELSRIIQSWETKPSVERLDDIEHAQWELREYINGACERIIYETENDISELRNLFDEEISKIKEKIEIKHKEKKPKKASPPKTSDS